MAGTPNRTLAEFLRGSIDLTSDTLRVALFDDSVAFTFDPDTHEFVGDVLDGGTTAHELSGSSGYTGSVSRQTIANVGVTQDDADDVGVFSGDDVVWADVESIEDIQGWLVYKQIGGDDTTPGDDPLVMVVDDDMAGAPNNLPLTTNGSDIRVDWDDVGIATLEVA